MNKQNYKHAFLEFAVTHQVLRFGEFTLKSGRISPYFFNAGLFNTGQALGQLGRFYAQAIATANIEFDMLFGPAYKGIPLATATAIALAEQHGQNVPYAFNRKLAKPGGEGGTLVGAPLQDRVLIIDDVITAGTAIRQAMELINAAAAKPAGVVVCLDRQERGDGERSAIDEVQAAYSIPVISIVTLADVLQWVSDSAAFAAYSSQIQAYQARYGVTINPKF